MAPRMAPITNSKTHPRIVVTDKCCIVCNRSWSAKTPSGCRTHPRSQPPGIFSSGVGVDVPVVQFGRGRAPSGDDGHVAVDVDDHLVDLDGWKRIVPQVLDASLLGHTSPWLHQGTRKMAKGSAGRSSHPIYRSPSFGALSTACICRSPSSPPSTRSTWK